MIASLLDSQSTALTRPEQLMFSQFYLASAVPSSSRRPCWRELAGDCRPAESGQLLGSVWHEPKYRRPARLSYPRYFSDLARKFHSSQLADQITTLNPLIAERLQQYSQMYQSQIGDSTLLNVQATTLLQNASTLQANILAYNDTYLLTAAISAATLVWIFWRLIRLRITARIALKRATGNK